jgi:hypothetical protein
MRKRIERDARTHQHGSPARQRLRGPLRRGHRAPRKGPPLGPPHGCAGARPRPSAVVVPSPSQKFNLYTRALSCTRWSAHVEVLEGHQRAAPVSKAHETIPRADAAGLVLRGGGRRGAGAERASGGGGAAAGRRGAPRR